MWHDQKAFAPSELCMWCCNPKGNSYFPRLLRCMCAHATYRNATSRPTALSCLPVLYLAGRVQTADTAATRRPSLWRPNRKLAFFLSVSVPPRRRRRLLHRRRRFFIGRDIGEDCAAVSELQPRGAGAHNPVAKSGGPVGELGVAGRSGAAVTSYCVRLRESGHGPDTQLDQDVGHGTNYRR